MRRFVAVVFCLSLVLAGCMRKEAATKEEISKDLAKRGTTDLMQEIAKDKYTPPADGRLKDSQIRMYLKVREHEKKIAQVAKEEMKQHAEKARKKGGIGGMLQGIQAMGSAADFATADLRAAKDLGYNTQEYIWVKAQVLAASTSAMAEKFNAQIAGAADKAYDDAKKAYDDAKDEQTKKLYADVLAGYDKTRQEMAKQQQAVDPEVAYNRQLLSKYENALNAFASELSKYENKPGEVDQAMKEMEKKQ